MKRHLFTNHLLSLAAFLVVVVGGLFLVSTPTLATTSTYSYTGAQQTFVVPSSVSSITIHAYGAQGGTGGYGGTTAGGLGGYAKGNLSVTPGQTLYIYVGQLGQTSVSSSSRPTAYNGGGAGYGSASGSSSRGGGGGASDVRVGSTATTSRAIVAGGGGGSTGAGGYAGGIGGGLTGGVSGQTSGTGGTQSAGGVGGYCIPNGGSGGLGFGGGANAPCSSTVAGGGGGYYGGGTGSGGGGGSSYIGGVTSATTTSGLRTGDGVIYIVYFNPPSATPTLSSATAGTSTIQINWDAVTNTTYYTVSSTAGTVTTTATTSLFSGLTPSTTYYFQISATNGDGSSSFSTSTAVETNAIAIASAPTIASFSSMSSTTIRINWSTVLWTSYYTVSSTAGTVTTTATTSLFSSLTPTTSYNFQVKSTDIWGRDTNYSSVGTTSTFPYPPIAPTLSSATIGTSTIQINWDAISGVSYYTVSSTAGATVTTTATTSLFSGLTPSTTYYFQVSATDVYGQTGSYSTSTATETNAIAIASAPTISSLSNITSSNIKVNWSTVLWTSYYTVSSSAGIVTTTATSSTISGLTPTTSYNFQVKSTDIWGRDTDYSTVVTTSTLPVPPTTPTFTNFSNVTTTIYVTWGAVAGASYYTVSSTIVSTSTATGVTSTYSYTGAQQTFVVPTGTTNITIYAYGAQGGDGMFSGVTGTGALGGYASGVLSVTPAQTLYIYVGQQGQVSNSTSNRPKAFNGGGAGYGSSGTNTRGGGGGASDVRVGSTATTSRAIVAGGGGGSVNSGLGGAGGGLVGGTGNSGSTPGGGGGTQSAGGGGFYCSAYSGNGGLGFGGGADSPCGSTVEGGGGGYYGGGDGSGGGGGSSYIGGVTSATTTAGVRSGNGQVIISYNSVSTTAGFSVTTTQTNYAFVSLSPNTSYSFQIKATDAYGQSSSYSSVSSTITTIPPPVAPTFTSATIGTSTLSINWEAISSTASTAYYTVSSTVGTAVTTTATTSLFSGLTPSTTYYFQVKATDVYGQTGNYATTTAVETDAIAIASAPVISSFSNVASTTIQINWGSVLWNSYYTVSSTAGTVTTTATSSTFTGLTPTTSYNFQVKSTDIWGRSTSYSSPSATSTLYPALLSAPSITAFSNNTSTAGSGSSVQVNWGAVIGTSYYSVLVATSTVGGFSTVATSTVVGSGVTNDYFFGPMYRSSAASLFDYSRYSYLYTASDLPTLTAGNTITAVSWYKTSAFQTLGNASFKIYMKNSSTSTLYTGTAWASIISGATNVYSNTSQTIPVTTGYITFTLDTPFVYTGGSLEISTDWDISAVGGNPTDGAFYWYSTNLPGKAIGMSNSSLPTILQTTTYGDYRPNIQFNYTREVGSDPTLGPVLTSATTTNTNYNFTGLTPSTTYYFQVNAADVWNRYGASSTIMSTSTPPPPIPEVPTISTFTRTTSTLQLTWANIAGATLYTVSSTAGTVTTTATTTSFTGLTPATDYSFQIKAHDDYNQTSSFSSVSTTPTMSLPPTIASFFQVTTSSMQVVWSAVTNTTYYTVSSTAGTVTTTATSYTFTGLALDTNYFVQVSSDLSDYSNISNNSIIQGVFTSAIKDTTHASLFGNITWTENIPTSTWATVEVQAGDSADLSDGVWTTVTNGQELNTNFDGHRYFQYRVTMFSASLTEVPSISDVNIVYYDAYTGSLISSPYNTSDPLNIFNKIAWTSSTPAGTSLQFQVRTSPDNATWTNWLGPDGSTSTYFTDDTGGETLPATLTDGVNDEWIQYQAYFVGNGLLTPTLYDVTMTYVVNAAPEILITTSTLAQAANGTVTIPYSVRDVDSASGAISGVVNIALQYCTANCANSGSETWATAASSSLSGDYGSSIAVDMVSTTNYLDYSITWTPNISYDNSYNGSNFKIRLVANDSEPANNLGTVESNTFILDTTDPTISSVVIDARSDASASLTITASDNTMSGLLMKISNNSNLSADGLNGSSGNWIPYNATSTWVFNSGTQSTVYYQFKDAYGNISNNNTISSASSPYAPINMVYRDISNQETSEWREFIAWGTVVAPTPGFKQYSIYRSTDGSNYTVLATEIDRTVNYYIDQGLDASTTYYYKIVAEDNDNNISKYSNIVSDQPNGQGANDTTPPTVSNVATSSVGTQSATVTWDTDELASSYVDYITITGGDFSSAPSIGVTSMLDTVAGIGQHSVVLTGLTPNTTYYFRVRSLDPAGNEGLSTTNPDGYSFTTLSGPTISNVAATNIINASATITWDTNTASDSYVYYATNANFSVVTTDGTANSVTTHSVTLTGLQANTTYYYYVKSDVAEDKNVINGIVNYYTFKTTNDLTGPVISFDSNTDISGLTDNQLTVFWTTNEAASSTIEYGLDTNYGTLSSNDNYNTSHSYTISSLTAGTPYYFRIKNTDVNGNISNATTFSTSTTDSSDFTPPIITFDENTDVTVYDAAVTVSWTTNEVATSSLAYGLTTAYGTTSSNDNYNMNHSYTISSLTPSTTYYFRLLSSDSNHNMSSSTEFTTTTSNSADATPPVITSVTTTVITDTQALITWNTDEGANSRVFYGTTSGVYNSSSTLIATYNLSHASTITSLTADTNYYYIVVSTDSSNNTATSSEATFKTLETLSQESQVIAREAAASQANPPAASSGGGSSYVDRTPPTISEVKLTDIGASKATFSWKTDEDSDGVVEFGTKEGEYGKVSVETSPRILKKSHELTLFGLDSVFTYYYKLTSADANHNISQPNTGTFTTISTSEDLLSTSTPSDIAKLAPEDAQKILISSFANATNIIKDMTSKVGVDNYDSPLLDFLNSLSSFLPLPLISGQPVVETTAHSATISWKTDKQANSLVSFKKDGDDTSLASQTTGNHLENVTDHSVELTGLDPDTLYHYSVISRTLTGAETRSPDFTFKTNLESNDILNYKVDIVSPSEVVFSWQTSLPTQSNVSFTPYRNGTLAVEAKQTSNDKSLTLSHSVKVTSLEAGVLYDIELFGKDIKDNIVSKTIKGFSSERENLPPVIYQIQTDSAIIPGDKERTQVIISWYTNELATSRVFYQKGFSKENTQLTNSTDLDTNYTKKHVVVISDFDPGAVYQFQVESTDSSQNTSLSKTINILTPRKEQSVFQVIFSNIQSIFSWVGKVKG